jgi:hypothetical protein
MYLKIDGIGDDAMSFTNVSQFFIFQKMKISYISIDLT